MVTVRVDRRLSHPGSTAHVMRLAGLAVLLIGLCALHGLNTGSAATNAAPGVTAMSVDSPAPVEHGAAVRVSTGGHGPVHPTHDCVPGLPRQAAEVEAPCVSPSLLGPQFTGHKGVPGPSTPPEAMPTALSPTHSRTSAVLQV